MKRNNFWRFIIVVLVLLWSIYELYPPTNRDLIQVFREKARNTDTNFHAIVERVNQLQQEHPERPYENLSLAADTNDLIRYFPAYGEAKNEAHPKTYILNRLQRDASGKIKLGLDLQGGTSILVRMNTSSITNQADTHAALSQAVEVLPSALIDLAWPSR